MFACTEFVLSEDRSQKTREDALRKLTTSDRNPDSGDPTMKAAARTAPDDRTTQTAVPDHSSGRVEASNMTLSDSASNSGNFHS